MLSLPLNSNLPGLSCRMADDWNTALGKRAVLNHSGAYQFGIGFGVQCHAAQVHLKPILLVASWRGSNAV